MTKKIEIEENDIWRHSKLRLFGYINELGESFRPLFPRFVIPSYCLAMAYVTGDTIDKSIKAKRKKQSVSITALDTLLWQTFASVIIPGFTINRTVAMMKLVVEKSPYKNPKLKIWLPIITGLSTIPIIIHPVDTFVDYSMDKTIRTFYDISK